MSNPNPFLRSPFDVLIDEQKQQAAADMQTVRAPEAVGPVPAPAAAPSLPAAPSMAAGGIAAPKQGKPDSLAPPDALRPKFETAAKEYGVPVNVLMALAHQESTYDPMSVNKSSGAKGLMNYMDATSSALGFDPFDTDASIKNAAKQLRERLDKGESMDDAVKHHFAGPDRKLWGDKTAAYGTEVLAKAKQIGAMLYPEQAPAQDGTAASDNQAALDKINGIKPNKFSPTMARSEYLSNFQSMNPQADAGAVKAVMAQYDAAQEARTKAGGNRVQDKFAQMQSPEATFNAKLNAKLQAGNEGLAQALPGNAAPANPVTGTPAARPDIIDQAQGDFGRGMKNLQALGYGAAGLAAEASGKTDDATEFLNKYVAIQNETAKTNPATIGTYKNVKNLGDAGRYAIEAVAENLPMLIPSLVTGGVGALAGKEVAKRLVVGMVQSQVEKGVAREVAEQAAAKFVARTIMAGSAAGAAASSVPMEAGSIMGDIYQDTGKKEVGTALAYGIPAGLLDTLEPVMALRKIAGPVVDQVAGSIFKRLGVEAGKQFIVEAGTEGLQTILEEAGKTQANGKKLFTPELADQVIDSMLKGGIGGAGIGVMSQGVHEARGALESRQGSAGEREIAAEINRQAGEVNFVGQDDVARAATDPNNESIDPRYTTMTPAQRAATVPAAGPLTAATHEAAAGAAPRVVAETAQGVVAGTVLDEQQDGDNLIATIMGDDGQVHQFNSAEGGSIAPVVAPAGPLTAALGEGAAAHDASPAPVPEAPPAPAEPAGPVPLEGLSMDELKARVAYVNEQAKRNGGATMETMKERKRVEKQMKVLADHAIATSKPAEEPITMGPFDDIKAANKMLVRAAESTGQMHEVVEKDGKFTIKPYQEKNDEKTSGNADAPGDGNGRVAGDQAAAQDQRDQQGRSAPDQGAGADGRAVPGKPTPSAGTGVAVPSAAADAKPTLTPKQAEMKARKAAREKAAGPSVANFTGKQIDADWHSFAKKSGTLNVDRSEMPQVAAEHRGALVNFLAARDITHEQVEMPAHDLKATQREFSPAKVEKARAYEGGDRSILVSSDNHVLDGHHQWLAKLDDNAPVKVIKLNAPIRELLAQVKEFPSAEVVDGATTATPAPTEQVNVEPATPAAKPAKRAAAKSKPVPASDVPSAPVAEHERSPYTAYAFSTQALADAFMAKKSVDAAKFEVKQTGPARWQVVPRELAGVEVFDLPAKSGKKAAPERDLIIAHNLTESNLLHAHKMGGIAVPSLAVTRKGQSLDGFGAITMIGSKDLADPKGYAKTQVFGADIYSPRYPSVERDLDRKAVAALDKKFRPMADKMNTGLPGSDELQRNGIESMERSPAVMAQFLTENGIDPAMTFLKGFDATREARLREFGLGPYIGKTDAWELRRDEGFRKAALAEIIATYEKIDGKRAALVNKIRTDEATQDNFIRSAADEIVRDGKLRKRPELDTYATRSAMEKQVADASLAKKFQQYVAEQVQSVTKSERIFQGFTNSGNRKYIPHTLENVVKILKKEMRGGENFNYGVGSLRAKFTPQFKSIADIQKNKDRLVSHDQFETVKKEIDDEFFAVGQAMLGEKYRSETVTSILEDASRMGLERAAAQFNVTLTPEAKQMAAEFLTRLHHLPTEYFEAKITREVDLSEFSGAVIPKDTSQEVRDLLAARGVPVKEYASETERKQAVSDFADELDQSKGDILFDLADERTIEVDGVRRPINNSNGKPVAQTFAGQVAFWKWFGDSKSVDEKGRPLTVYHGTNANIESFSIRKAGSNVDSGFMGTGFYFTDRADIASSYANMGRGALPNVMQNYLSLKNPYQWGHKTGGVRSEVYGEKNGIPEELRQAVFERAGFKLDVAAEPDFAMEKPLSDALREELIARGYDGVIATFKSGGIEAVAFYPEQIKSATGNNGKFDPDDANITRAIGPLRKLAPAVETAPVATLAEDGPLARMAEPKRVATLQKLRQVHRLRAEGKIDDTAYRARIEALIGKLEDRNASKVPAPRERGAEWVTERLMRARRTGELDSETVDFALWALNKAPSLANDLAISIRAGNEMGTAGSYQSAERLMSLFKGAANEGTAVHEMLHHSERMMPAAIQQKISQAWFDAYMREFEKSTPAVKLLMEDMLAMSADRSTAKRTIKAFADGKLQYDTHYQLVNASEYWAVNATRIMGERFGAQSWQAKAKRWLSEMIQTIKGLLKLPSDAAVLKGLQSVIDGTGERLSPRMLMEGATFRDMESKDYPLAPRDEWYGEGTFEKDGARMVRVAPDDYLAAVRPLVMDEESRENIDILKEHIQAGKTLDPLLIRANGKEDGRHRAYAAKELGIKSVPVIAYGKQFQDAPDYAPITRDITAGTPPATPVPPAAPTTLATYKPSDEGLTAAMRTVQAAIQDNQNRINQVQANIVKESGAALPGRADYYAAETNRPGRIAARLEDMRDGLIEPMMQRLAKSGHTPEQMEELLHAMHAKERNEAVAAINPEHADTEAAPGSGMADSKADEVIDKYKDAAELHAIADQARAITAATLDLKLAYGLITPEKYDTLTEAYEHYVPLKGDGEYGPKMKRAMGHGEREEFIVQNIARDYAQAVVVGEKNLARQSLLQMVLQFPDAELWTARVPPKGRNIAGQVFYVKKGDVTVASYTDQAEVNAFLEAKGSQAGQYTVEDSAGESVVQFTKPLQDNEVMVYVKGQAVRLQILDEKLAAQLRPLNQGQMNAGLEFMRQVNGYLSKIYTGYNPSFILRNTARDAMTGTINMMGNQGTAIAAKAWAKYPKALVAMLKWAHTKEVPTGRMGEYLNEYRQQGGKVGASYMSDLEDTGKSIERMYDDAAGLVRTAKTGSARRTAIVAWDKTVMKLAHAVEVANQGTENALRLSLFAALREAGHTPGQAAQAAKGVTVDFDRKGTATPSLGALYLFTNPAVQGTANAMRTLSSGKHKGQAWAALGALGALGYFLAAAGMDDDKDRWMGEAWDVRAKNVRYRVGSQIINIPVSQEFAPFFAFGTAMAEAGRGESKTKASARMLSSFLDAYVPLKNLYNPESDAPGMDALVALTPTIATNLVQTATNRNSFGTKIVPEGDNTKGHPDNLKMNRGTKNSAYDTVAQAVAGMGVKTGFSREYENDITKISPETLKLWWRAYTGGLGSFIADTVGVTRMAGDDTGQIVPGDVPFVKDFVKPVTVRPLQGRYYELTREARGAIDEFKQAKKAGNAAAIEQLTSDQEKKKVLGLGRMVQQTTKAAGLLADQAVDINAQKDLTGAEKRTRLKELEKQQEELYRAGIKVFTER